MVTFVASVFLSHFVAVAINIGNKVRRLPNISIGECYLYRPTSTASVGVSPYVLCVAKVTSLGLTKGILTTRRYDDRYDMVGASPHTNTWDVVCVEGVANFSEVDFIVVMKGVANGVYVRNFRSISVNRIFFSGENYRFTNFAFKEGIRMLI